MCAKSETFGYVVYTRHGKQQGFLFVFCLYILLYSQQIMTPRVFKIECTITM